MKNFQTRLIYASILSGFLSFLILLSFLFLNLSFFLNEKVSVHLLTKFGVLSGEVIISILFSVLLFLFKSKFGNYKIIGGIRILFSILMLVSYKDVWYYLLDPHGSFLISYPILLLGFAQALFLLIPSDYLGGS